MLKFVLYLQEQQEMTSSNLRDAGFRIDPSEKLEETFQELRNLHDIYSTCPDFGVDFVFESEAPPIDQSLQVSFTGFSFRLNLYDFFQIILRIKYFDF